jgi:hypothetical protein
VCVQQEGKRRLAYDTWIVTLMSPGSHVVRLPENKRISRLQWLGDCLYGEGERERVHERVDEQSDRDIDTTEMRHIDTTETRPSPT